MNKIISLLLLCAIAVTARSQSVGIGTGTPNASALLDITATNKGLLIPRMNTAAITAISNPAKGLMVLDSAKNQLMFNVGTPAAPNWQTIAFNSGWGTTGNTGTNAATNFIGTSDDNDVVIKRNNVRAGLINDALENTSWGVSALNPATTGIGNVANGYVALANNTSGYGNTAAGYYALNKNTSGYGNTAIGLSTLSENTVGHSNSAFGSQALDKNTSGTSNTATGQNALYSDTSGSNNTASGFYALAANANGNNNSAYGFTALSANTTGGNNTAFGANAGHDNTTGSNNVFLGYQAGQHETGSNKLYISNSGGDANNALIYGEFDNKFARVNGKLAIKTTPGNIGIDLSSSDAYSEMRVIRNTLNASDKDLYLGFGSPATSAVKLYSGGTIAVAFIKDNQVGIGQPPLTTNDDSRLQIKQQSSQNGIGVVASNSTNHWDFFTTLDAASDFSMFYNGALKGSFDHVTGTYAATSDRRLKKDITAQQPVLKNVLQLQAYQYHYLDNQPSDRFSNGFMAQDVQHLFPDAVVVSTMKDGQKRLGINYQYFTILAIKGLQEQQQQIQTLEQRIEKLEALIQNK